MIKLRNLLRCRVVKNGLLMIHDRYLLKLVAIIYFGRFLYHIICHFNDLHYFADKVSVSSIFEILIASLTKYYIIRTYSDFVKNNPSAEDPQRNVSSQQFRVYQLVSLFRLFASIQSNCEPAN